MGVYSSRRLARACEERLDFMAVTAQNRPDFRTISEFRRRHLEALSGLFLQVLRLCQKAKLVELGHVALDGTRMKANASKHKAMSYGRMKKTEPEPAAEVDAWLKAAEAADAEEDRAFGDKRGDEMPDWVANKAKRREKIREAMAALETPAQISADTGYCSEANILAMEDRKIKAFIATGRQKHGQSAADGGKSTAPKTEEMREHLREGGFDSPYRLRKQTVEPVFGQIKQARGFRQFLMRGIKKVTAEWAMLCTVHNILKLAGAAAAA